MKEKGVVQQLGLKLEEVHSVRKNKFAERCSVCLTEEEPEDPLVFCDGCGKQNTYITI
jgi:rRNA maturation endonuclease Nob1